jgi:hypothetical protein
MTSRHNVGVTYPRAVSHSPVHTPPRRRMPRWQLALLAAIVALVLAGVATLVVLLVGGRTASGTMTVSGSVELKADQFVWETGNPATCAGTGGYSDLHGGADVSIANAAGSTVAVGRFQTGTPRGLDASHTNAEWCSLWFTISGVPRGVGPYGLWVTHRGPNRYTEAELTRTLTLGFD